MIKTLFKDYGNDVIDYLISDLPKRWERFDDVAILPIIIYVPSAGLLPIHPSIIASNKNIQNNILQIGLKVADLTLEVSSHGSKNKTKIALNIAITPPNLSGIALNIA